MNITRRVLQDAVEYGIANSNPSDTTAALLRCVGRISPVVTVGSYMDPTRECLGCPVTQAEVVIDDAFDDELVFAMRFDAYIRNELGDGGFHGNVRVIG